jgi:hypothetical protein
MREASMMCEAEGRASKNPAEDVEIRRFSGQGERKRGQRGFAVESGASKAGTG